MTESSFVEIINKNEKNMVAGCIYKQPKQTIADFLDNHLYIAFFRKIISWKQANSDNGRFQHKSS